MTESSSPVARLFAELKRRRVIRVALVYAVGAWAVLQGAATIGQLLELPGWVGKLIVALVAAGFPIALGLAWAFDVTPEGLERTPPPSAPLLTRRSAWFVIGILVAMSAGFYVYSRKDGSSALDANAVAVLPFRVSTADPSLQYLSEGMVDLLGAKLSGEGGPRALDPRAVISAIRQTGIEAEALDPDNSLGIARRLGAGLLLRGEIVGSAKHVTLSAVLIDSRSGSEKTRHSVEGSPDSLSVLVDRLTTQILVRGARVPEDQIAKFAYVPLPAVQAYLAAQLKYRHGEYNAAVQLYKRALQIDSTFIAVLPGYVAALEWSAELEQAIPQIQRLSSGLSERDRALVGMFIPEVFDGGPAHVRDNTFVKRASAAVDRALRLAPDNPEAHYVHGDIRFHYGFPENPARDLSLARQGFEGALKIDSTFAPALGHMVEVAALQRDTVAVRRYIRRYIAADSAGDLSDHIRWVAAHALGDSARIRALRAGYASMSRENLARMLGSAQLGNFALAEAELVAEALARRQQGWQSALEYALSRGRDDAMGRALRIAPPQARFWPVIIGSIFAHTDSAAAYVEVRDAEARIARKLPASPTRAEQGRRAADLFLTSLWHLSRGRPRDVTEAVRAVAEFSPTDALVLETLAAHLDRSPNPNRKLAELDSMIHAGAYSAEALLVAARLHETNGDKARALEVLRTRANHWGGFSYLPTFLKEEGRLAAQLGDRAAAITAYTHYLDLRSDPSPRFVPERNWVRAELAKLTRDR